MTLNHALLLHSFAPPHTQASPSTLHFPSRSHQLSSRSLPSYPLLDRHAPPYPALHISFSLSNQSCFSPLHTSTPPLLPSAILHIRLLSHSSPHPSPRPPSFLISPSSLAQGPSFLLPPITPSLTQLFHCSPLPGVRSVEVCALPQFSAFSLRPSLGRSLDLHSPEPWPPLRPAHSGFESGMLEL